MVAKKLILAKCAIFVLSLYCVLGYAPVAADDTNAKPVPAQLKQQEAELEHLFSQMVFDLAQSAYREGGNAQKSIAPHQAPEDPLDTATINEDTTIISLVDCTEIAGNYIRLIDVANFRRDPNKLESIISDLIISPAPAMDKSCQLTRQQITKRLTEYNIPMNNISFTGAQEVLVLRTKAALPDLEEPAPKEPSEPPEAPGQPAQPEFPEQPEFPSQPNSPDQPVLPQQPDDLDNAAPIDASLPIGSMQPIQKERRPQKSGHLEKEAPVLIIREGALFRMEEWGIAKTAGQVGDRIDVADRNGRIFAARITRPNTVVPIGNEPNDAPPKGNHTAMRTQ